MLAENISSSIAKELKINPHQSDAVIKLLDEGNTIPFISRYRKEATGESLTRRKYALSANGLPI